MSEYPLSGNIQASLVFCIDAGQAGSAGRREGNFSLRREPGRDYVAVVDAADFGD